MSEKMGRPKSEEPKDKNITFRMTQSRYQNLKQYAEFHGQTVTQVIEKAIDQLIQK